MADIFRKAQRIVPGQPVFVKTNALVACEVAGWVNLVLESGDVLPYYAVVGSYELGNYAIQTINFTNLPGSAATCTISAIS